METTTNILNKYYKMIKNAGWWLTILFVPALIIFNYMIPEWVAIPTAGIKVGVFLLGWWYIDEKIFTEWDTLDEIINKKNLPFTIWFCTILFSYVYLVARV